MLCVATTRRACFAVVAVCLLGSAPAAAGPIVLAENLFTGNAGGYNGYSFPDGIHAEDFALTGTFEITAMSHVAHHRPGLAQPSSFDWWIYADGGASPGAVLASGAASPFTAFVEQSIEAYDLTRYTVSTSVTLGPGTYWVGFSANSPVPGDPHWTASFAGSSINDINAHSDDGGKTWSGFTNVVFRIEGEAGPQQVPEPGSLLLLGGGLSALVLMARRRARRRE